MATCQISYPFNVESAQVVHFHRISLLFLLNYCLIKYQHRKLLKAYSSFGKKSLFADDASFILDVSLTSFEQLTDVLDNFSYISGLKLNEQKCQVLRIRAKRQRNLEYLKHQKYRWSSTEATALGMIFTTTKPNIFQANLEPKVNENCLKQWHHRK